MQEIKKILEYPPIKPNRSFKAVTLALEKDRS